MRDLDYLAGVFDGEGTACYSITSNSRRVSIANTDLDILRECQRICLAHSIPCYIASAGVPKEVHHKECFELHLSGREAFEQFLAVVPLVSVRKREALQRIVQSYRVRRITGGGKVTLEYY